METLKLHSKYKDVQMVCGIMRGKSIKEGGLGTFPYHSLLE